MAHGTVDHSAHPAPPARPAATTSDRIKAGVVAVIFIALCVATWISPDLIHIDTSDLSGRKGRGLANIINLLWSRPVGTVAGLIGLLAIWGVLSGSPKGGASDDTHAA